MKYKNKKPLVSVIMPVYNGEKFVGEAIESVVNQTYKNWEIIIVDDGSTDNSKKIIDQYLTDSRIHYIKHSKNQGIPSARNTGIKASQGDFIAFLDQDDIWFPKKLEKQIAIFKCRTHDCGMVFSDKIMLRDEGFIKVRKKSRRIPKNINRLPLRKVTEALFLYNFISIITVMIRRECLETVGLLDESIKGGADDYEFCLRLATKHKIKYLSIPLAIHRIHKANYSDVERFFQDNLFIMDKAFAQAPFLAALRKKKLAMLYYDLGRYYQQEGRFHHAREALWKAVRYYPLKIKPFLALLLCFFGRWGNRMLRVYRTVRVRMERDGTI